jgi:RecB family exonuclease
LALAYDRDPVMKSQYRRPSTFSELGEVSHKLTEWVWKGRYNETPAAGIREALNQAWNELVAEAAASLASAWSPLEPPEPADWPFYALSRSRTLARLRRDAERFQAHGDALAGDRPPIVEGWLIDESIRLRGRPDRVHWRDGASHVVDLKAGPHVSEISPDHLQQLLLYAHLVRVSTGSTPHDVAVLNAVGTLFVREITSADVDEAVADFVERSNAFSEYLQDRDALLEKATPSAAACKSCSYRAICPAFEASNDSTWDARYISGVVSAAPTPTAIRVEVVSPSDRQGESVSLLLAQPRQISVGARIACVDVYLDTAPVRLAWNSTLVEWTEAG